MRYALCIFLSPRARGQRKTEDDEDFFLFLFRFFFHFKGSLKRATDGRTMDIQRVLKISSSSSFFHSHTLV